MVGVFSGHAMVVRSFNGDLLGIHWAWGKTLLLSIVPPLSHIQFPPLDGYGFHIVNTFGLPLEIIDAIRDNTGDLLEFSYAVRLSACHDRNGLRRPCSIETLPEKVGHVLWEYGSLIPLVRNCLCNGAGFYCPLRAQLDYRLRYACRKLLRKSYRKTSKIRQTV